MKLYPQANCKEKNRKMIVFIVMCCYISLYNSVILHCLSMVILAYIKYKSIFFEILLSIETYFIVTISIYDNG